MTLLRSFRGVVICAAGLSVVCFCVGLTGSYLWGTPVGATVVLVNLAAFLLSRGVMEAEKSVLRAFFSAFRPILRVFLRKNTCVSCAYMVCYVYVRLRY